MPIAFRRAENSTHRAKTFGTLTDLLQHLGETLCEQISQLCRQIAFHAACKRSRGL